MSYPKVKNEFNNLEKQVDDAIHEMEYKVFNSTFNWKKHFALLPVKIDNEYIWLKTVYRKKAWVQDTKTVTVNNGLYSSSVARLDWKYGTIFDVLKDEPDATT